jgi:hypothetical protein
MGSPLLRTLMVIASTRALAIPTVPTTANEVLAAYHAAVGEIPSTGSAELDYAYSGNGLEGASAPAHRTGLLVPDNASDRWLHRGRSSERHVAFQAAQPPHPRERDYQR